VFVWRDDLYVPGADVWLDPHRHKQRAIVSHAHGDHIGRHKRTWTSRETAALMRARLGELAVEEVPFGQWVDLGREFRMRLHPAGHILGAAQVEIERHGERLVYTGDFRLAKSETAAECAIVPCEILVMECTFGRPHYRFPPRSEVVPKLAADLKQILADEGTPVLLAYSVGRSQELLKLLEPYGFPFALAPPIYAMVKVYEALGVSFPPYVPARPGETAGRVVLVPPHLANGKIVTQARRPVRIAATGWACDERTPYPSDRSYPLSDHADFDELLRYVELARPREVYTMHGFDEFRDHLRQRGIHAHPVEVRVPTS
jgi:Cft2 family RNA processing exonuclease